MARNKGTFPFAANFEVKAASPLDPRVLVEKKSELISKDTWPLDGDTLYIYKGLLVSVQEEHAVYMLVDPDKILAEDYSGWERKDGSEGGFDNMHVISNLTIYQIPSAYGEIECDVSDIISAIDANKQIYIRFADNLPGLTPCNVYLDDFYYISFVWDTTLYRLEIVPWDTYVVAYNTLNLGPLASHSDWSASDESDPAYIRNRTHYKIEDISYGTSTGYGDSYYDDDDTPITPNRIRVRSEEGCVSDWINVYDGYSEYFVELYLYDEYGNTQDIYSGHITVDMYTSGVELDMGSSGYYVDLDYSTIKKLSEEFIPDTIARKSDLENIGGDGSSTTPDWNAEEGEQGHILNRPCYYELSEMNIFETEVMADSSYQTTMYGGDLFRFKVLGETFDIDLSGKEIPTYDYDHEIQNKLSYTFDIDSIRVSVDFFDAGDGALTMEFGYVALEGKEAPDGLTLYVAEYVVSGRQRLSEGLIPQTIARKSELTELSAELGDKQDTISDLETIRSGAAKGATALQSVPDTYATKTYVDNAISEIPQGGGEPSQYIKDASKSADGNTLTLTKKDGSVVSFSPSGGGGGMTTPSGDPMHYMYEAVGAEWNGTGADIEKQGVYGDTITHKAGYWYLNELGDITTEEIREIYLHANLDNSVKGVAQLLQGIKTRTNIATWSGTWNNRIKDTQMFGYADKLKTALLRNADVHYTDTNASFIITGCYLLEKIFPTIDASNTTSFNGAFDSAPCLKEIRLKNVKVPVKFNSTLISKASILYLIQNSAATSAITVTLHADAYARLAEDADIVAALAEKTNVSLAK